ncbi:uncharacterized protein SCHCODRAFT_01174748 [Schizophyllum commune H4-8]|nr:uncharacterized protein SCHCODRAFT_01174748 [Schizophyllum commune H4-8]KAI5888880.1 hypothetical protein SCHCODRAFT_01174748 [Schizophyllum commune H4-8]
MLFEDIFFPPSNPDSVVIVQSDGLRTAYGRRRIEVLGFEDFTRLLSGTSQGVGGTHRTIHDDTSRLGKFWAARVRVLFIGKEELLPVSIESWPRLLLQVAEIHVLPDGAPLPTESLMGPAELVGLPTAEPQSYLTTNKVMDWVAKVIGVVLLLHFLFEVWRNVAEFIM